MSKSKDAIAVKDSLAFIMGRGDGVAMEGPQEGHNVATEGPQEGHNVATEGPQEGHNVATLRPVHIRLNQADYMALGTMASERGTTRAALIRQAIKGLLRGEV